MYVSYDLNLNGGGVIWQTRFLLEKSIFSTPLAIVEPIIQEWNEK